MTACLSVHGAEAAIRFYTTAFGAREIMRQQTPDGKILHGRLKIGDSVVMISDIYASEPPGPAPSRDGPIVTLHLYVPDVDAVWAQAVRAGASVEMPLGDTFWGERYGMLQDPYGLHWSLSTPLRMSAARKAALREESMRSFGAGDPGA